MSLLPHGMLAYGIALACIVVLAFIALLSALLLSNSRRTVAELSLATANEHLHSALEELASTRAQLRRALDACAGSGDVHSADQLASDAGDNPLTLLLASVSALRRRMPNATLLDNQVPDGELQLTAGQTVYRDSNAATFGGDVLAARLAFRSPDQSCLLWKRRESHFCPPAISSFRRWRELRDQMQVCVFCDCCLARG